MFFDPIYKSHLPMIEITTRLTLIRLYFLLLFYFCTFFGQFIERWFQFWLFAFVQSFRFRDQLLGDHDRCSGTGRQTHFEVNPGKTLIHLVSSIVRIAGRKSLNLNVCLLNFGIVLEDNIYLIISISDVYNDHNKRQSLCYHTDYQVNISSGFPVVA